MDSKRMKAKNISLTKNTCKQFAEATAFGALECYVDFIVEEMWK